MIELKAPCHVNIKNAAQAQHSQGVAWFGSMHQPRYVVVSLPLGSRPLQTDSLELLQHVEDGVENIAVYGDRRILKHSIDSELGRNTRHFFPTLKTVSGAYLLARWLLRRMNQNMSEEDLAKAVSRMQGLELRGWCEEVPDLLDPKSRGYLVFGEPTPTQLEGIFGA